MTQNDKNITLINALIRADLPAVKEALASGANPNVKTATQYGTSESLLVYVCYKHSPVFAEALILAGADIESHSNGSTPLMKACFGNSAEMVRLLLRYGANVNASNKNTGRTAIHIAVEWRREEIIKVLLEAGANVNARTNMGNTPLILLACHGDTRDIIPLLMAGADINAANNKGETFEEVLKHNHPIEYKKCMRVVETVMKKVIAIDMLKKEDLVNPEHVCSEPDFNI